MTVRKKIAFDGGERLKIPYEMPPKLGGSAEQQLAQLRDFLERLILRLNEEEADA